MSFTKASRRWLAPEVAWINLTDFCNLRCSWCYAGSRVDYARSNGARLRNARDLICSLAKCNIAHIVYIGGEPTCSALLPEMIGWACEEGIGSSIATNGIALSNSRYCRSLKEKGLLSANISAKGFSEEEYFLNTGVKSFTLFLRALENVLNEGIELVVSLVLMPENVNNAAPFLRKLEEEGVNRFLLSFERSEVCGETVKSGSAERAAETIVEFERSYLDMGSGLRRKIDVELSYPRCVWDKAVLDMMESEGNTSNLCHVHMGNGIVINSAGELLLCNALPFPSFGQWGVDVFNDEDMLSAYSSEVCCDVLGDLLRFPDFRCASCEDARRCFGGCPIQWFAYDLSELRQAVDKKRQRA